MEIKHILVVAGVLGGVLTAGLASAQEVDPAPAAPIAPAGPAGPVAPAAPAGATGAVATGESDPTQGHASGMMVQARVQAQSNLLSIGGSGFVVGYQGPSFSLGVGLGLTRLGASSGGESASATLFQISPTATVDVWHSEDGRARANIVGSVGYARASLSTTGTTQSCSFDAFGNETCRNSSTDETASASLIPISLGFGGDYFLSRNFALGAEFGLQAMILAGASTSSGSSSSSVDAGGDLEFAYGALRATFVLGK